MTELSRVERAWRPLVFSEDQRFFAFFAGFLVFFAGFFAFLAGFFAFFFAGITCSPPFCARCTLRDDALSIGA